MSFILETNGHDLSPHWSESRINNCLLHSMSPALQCNLINTVQHENIHVSKMESSSFGTSHSWSLITQQTKWCSTDIHYRHAITIWPP